MEKKLSNGKHIPLVGFGVYRLSDAASMEQAIAAAYQTGYRMFDTAQMYKNEELLGQAIDKLNIDRNQIILTTKIAPQNMSEKNVRSSFLESLRKLKTDYIDILLIHWPGQDKERLLSCWNELIQLYKEGKAKAIGVSNAMVQHLEWLEECEIAPMIDQIEVNIKNQQKTVCAFCKKHGIAVQAWSPLARGQFDNPLIQTLSNKYNCTPAQLLLTWNTQKEISVIPKSSHLERIQENFNVGSFVIEEEDMHKIDKLDQYKDMSYNPYTYDY